MLRVATRLRFIEPQLASPTALTSILKAAFHCGLGTHLKVIYLSPLFDARTFALRESDTGLERRLTG